jgi:opacity protein-like surface antigen
MRGWTLNFVAVGGILLSGNSFAHAEEGPLGGLLERGPWVTVAAPANESETGSKSPSVTVLPCVASCTDNEAAGIGCCSLPTDCGGRHWYVSGIVGASFATLASGGTNAAEGPFQNLGSSNDSLFTAGGALGMAFARPGGQLRAEVEGRGRDKFVGQTESFQPPAPTTLYDVEAADGWSVTANLWRDFLVTDRLGLYGGGGLGGGGYRLSVSDGLVAGSDHVGGFAWQAGGGAFYRLNSRVTLDLGYRFFQIGNTTVTLQDLASEQPAGTYDSMFSASELLLTVRIYEPFARWRR